MNAIVRQKIDWLKEAVVVMIRQDGNIHIF